ncbi:uncharacterized protein L969DRAFT_62997 [Mixia osmundae IAM 14324]|uniref:Uncharacterized protein n=1 Tax=Mixia osmundae (strain CBS 9802 / IAM 14324 / JCM 22182 / KY 12970) TaxID=764103 RepID=G7E184_MIXOS|nr:uncharacterized protein L969DRAFT_62997 [Mixia osmundae IAM 14324]KEI38767.1 hypothetical protein L969DRAFT_62997 [Mixia osmundae IAM 14324]GAA96594.1 hypothetical protein E5Q_03264 [Mixia osmundae IAM 14324]
MQLAAAVLLSLLRCPPSTHGHILRMTPEGCAKPDYFHRYLIFGSCQAMRTAVSMPQPLLCSSVSALNDLRRIILVPLTARLFSVFDKLNRFEMFTKMIPAALVLYLATLASGASINAEAGANTLERRHSGSYTSCNLVVQPKGKQPELDLTWGLAYSSGLYTLTPSGLVTNAYYAPPHQAGGQQLDPNFVLDGDHFRAVLQVKVAGDGDITAAALISLTWNGVARTAKPSYVLQCSSDAAKEDKITIPSF